MVVIRGVGHPLERSRCRMVAPGGEQYRTMTTVESNNDRRIGKIRSGNAPGFRRRNYRNT